MKALFLCSFLVFVVGAFGQTPGQLNPEFYSGITGFGIGDGAMTKILKTVQLDDGKLLVSNPGMYNRNDVAALARLNADGTLDTTFKTDHETLLPAVDIAVQPDGKIVVGSDFYTNPFSITLLNRLHENGEMDTSFHCNIYGINGSNSVDIVRLQQDGKIIINGLFSEVNGVDMDFNSVCRIHPTGELDTTFHFSSPLSNAYVHEIVTRPDGKILISITGFDVVLDYVSQLLLLNNDGTMDTSFNVGTAEANSITDLKLQADGKILVGGRFNSYNGSEANRLLRLLSNGAIDSSFFVMPDAVNNVLSLEIYPDGRILVGTDKNTQPLSNNQVAVRLFSDGTVDQSFQLESSGYFEVYSMAITSDEKVVVSGNLDELNGTHFGKVARVEVTGEIDETFNLKNGVNDNNGAGIFTEVVQPDGRIIIGGYFNTVHGENHSNIARLLPNGEIDPSFQVIGYTGVVQALALTSDGKILVGGDIYNNVNLSGIMRLNSDGTIDPTFALNQAINYVKDIQVESNGKILVAGQFGNEKVFRLNSNGTVDASFISGFSANYPVYTICPLADGKIVVGGEFTTFGGSQYQGIARLTNFGGVDAFFTPVLFDAQASSVVTTIKQASDGSLIVTGSFELQNGQRNIARISADGIVDATFDPVFESYSSIHDFSIQDNGELVVVGDFSTLNGYGVEDVAALSASGDYLPAFDCEASSTYTSSVFTIQEMINGGLFIGGSFTEINGFGKNRMASIFGFDPYLGENILQEESTLLYPNPTSASCKIQSKHAASVVSVRAVNSLGQLIQLHWSEADAGLNVDLLPLTKGFYVLSVETITGITNYPLVID